MMETEVYMQRGSNNNPQTSGSKNWSTSSIPTLVSLDEGSILESSPPSKINELRRDSAGPGVPQASPRRDSTSSFLEELRLRSRRKSWQAKLERKRRKGVITPLTSGTSSTSLQSSTSVDSNTSMDTESVPSIPVGMRREKRPSWWNIFVPDNFQKSRSRRASQDVGHVARNSENIGQFLRSKSRSVDHGFNAPFDLEALRSKVEGRFESVDRLNKDVDNEKKKVEVPVKTIEYTVNDRDTLTSVAARFDTTPSELTKLNRLVSSFIFPGQILRVPDRSEQQLSSTDPHDSTHTNDSQLSTPTESHHEYHEDLPPEEKELLDSLRPVSPKPGHIERVRTPLGGSGSITSTSTTLSGSTSGVGSKTSRLDSQGDDDLAYRERFLKINVRHITDGQGVVGGVLLVTPNAIIFDPNVSDPLVIEHGPESYGVIAPMEFVVNAAIYYDIAHMRVGTTNIDNHSLSLTSSSNKNEKPEIYYAPNDKPPLSSDNNENDEGGGGGATSGGGGTDDTDSVCSCTERERGGDAFPKAFERDLVTPTNLQQDPDHDSLAHTILNSQSQRTLEERRKSLLDHHWAIPSKDRSLEESQTSQDEDTISTPAASTTETTTTTTSTTVEPVNINNISINNIIQTLTTSGIVVDPGLVKLSCHDSGIDIRDPQPQLPPIPIVPPNPTKKVYSDADIVLSNEWVPPITIAPLTLTSNTGGTGPGTGSLDTDSPSRKKASSVSFSLDSNYDSTSTTASTTTTTSTGTTATAAHDKDEEKTETKKNKMLKRLSYPLAWMETLTGSEEDKTTNLPHSADAHHSSVFSKVFSRRSSVGTFIRQHPNNSSSDSHSSKSTNKPPPPRLDYRSMVSVDDMPELFVSFDKLIPRPARSCEDPPLYLRLRMGKPSNRPIPRSTPLMSYGKKKMRPEYWFSVPKNRVDDLYRFLQLWVPQRYGELTDDEIRSRGFDPVESDTELWDDDSPTGRSGSASRNASQDQEGELARESWEALSRSEEIRQALYGFNTDSLEIEITPPDLVGTTEILTDEHREKLCRHLPARAEGYVWTLVFSTSQHGFSLNSMYRKMSKLESPILMVIEDTDNNVFGALTSCALKVSDHFYGTGESLLFRFSPKFQVFNWTGENLYFIKGNNESLSIGAGDGKFGIWLDGDLYQGRTEPCGTYGNEPLTPNVDFVVKTLECWAFI
ncbi:oxidation resistance protein 1 isoform X3 [Chrysoperla carnea]|uniref:oxidation resistance protein 1 isoform X3 n=1 Tax=Chrysoperla carnea TaxID=189513 RepID=UPI001D06A3AF|nr:oxidation resistance protein 1 isoform X3 [Chrysoperla carnea]